MKENEQERTDRNLDTPSESNREKHINFPEVEEDSRNIAGNSNSISERQKQWRQEIQEGEKEKENSDRDKETSSMPMDDDDTLGIP
jgi:hypothetical protein